MSVIIGQLLAIQSNMIMTVKPLCDCYFSSRLQAPYGHQILGGSSASEGDGSCSGVFGGGVPLCGGDHGEDGGHVPGAGGAVRAGEGHHAHGQGARTGLLQSGATMNEEYARVLLGNYLFVVELINWSFI